MLRRINHNLIQIRPLVIDPIVQSSHSDGIMRPLLQRQQQRRRKNNALVGIPLIERLHVRGIPVDHGAADATELP
jgi:hypothetical protein